MNRIVELRTHSAKHGLRPIAGIALLILLYPCLALRPAYADDANDQAREQFATAVRMRTMLEGYLEKDRSVSDYKQTIDAYEKVYQISARSEETPPALIAEAELYEEMGHLYDPKYFDSAIKTYDLLLAQYPGSRYCGAALFGTGQIEKDDQNKPAAAEIAFHELLKRYPHSDRTDDARKALKEIVASDKGKQTPTATNQTAPLAGSDAKANPPAQTAGISNSHAVTVLDTTDDAAITGTVVEPRQADGHLSNVRDLQTENTKDAARVVVLLDDTIEFQSARIASPDRIYFNLSRATLGEKAAGKQFDSEDGLLRSVRIAQNKPDVVRVVLDAPAAKDYSAYLLSKPYRLVIEVRSKAGTAPREYAASVTEDPVKPSAREAVVSGSDADQAMTTPVALERKSNAPSDSIVPTTPKPMNDGDTSLTRALGLKIRRIVIDPGHGGHDTGTIGPHGLLEKDLCLDVALRLGNLIQQKLPGAEVIYTRKDDTFVPLEERTQIANDARADLFISIHANSSHDESARGVETYYLNFSTSDESMEVAARENALSQESLHDLQDIIQKIARNDKIEESKELASDVQESLAHRLEAVSPGEKDRGVKKAPFVVLIGANMPSVLSEISFVSNPSDERLLKKPDQRQRIANGLYRGIAAYLDSVNSLSFNKQKLVSANGASDDRLEAGNASTSVK